MNRLVKSFVCFAFAVSFCSSAFSKENVHKLWMAEVNYEMSYSGFESEDMEKLPKRMVMLINGSNTCKIQKTESVTSYIIGNRDSMMLINMAETPELKSATVCDSADISEGRAGIKFDIQGKGKYKTIHGFPCHGYDIAMEDKETGEKYIEEIWATDYIGGADVNFYLYPDVKGVILYSKKTNGKEITIAEAKKIQKRVAIEAGTFKIPYGCEVNSCE